MTNPRRHLTRIFYWLLLRCMSKAALQVEALILDVAKREVPKARADWRLKTKAASVCICRNRLLTAEIGRRK
jgi:hypothetical protein